MDPNLPSAPFPAPPPFWKHFSLSNLQRFKDLESTDPSSSSTSLPLELTCLRPPPPPPPGTETYPVFSQPNIINVTPVLPPPHILLFDPDNPNLNHAALLTRLTKSLLLNFLELSTVLSEAPTEFAEKAEDIRRLVINVHAVINMYRPHQARENVKEMLQGMLEDGRREIEEGEKVHGEIEGFLEEVEGWKAETAKVKEGDGAVESNGIREEKAREKKEGYAVDEKRFQEARRLWSVMDEIGNE